MSSRCTPNTLTVDEFGYRGHIIPIVPPKRLMALEVGSRLGHYDVTALIGEGGMGQVYRATDTKLNRQETRREEV